MGDVGLYALSLLSGLLDVDAILLTVMHMNREGALHADQAMVAAGLAVLANMAMKAGLSWFAGDRPWGGRSHSASCWRWWRWLERLCSSHPREAVQQCPAASLQNPVSSTVRLLIARNRLDAMALRVEAHFISMENSACSL